MVRRQNLNGVLRRTAAVVSLHFSPAFISHTMAYAKALIDIGYAVSFALDEHYLPFGDFSSVAPVISRRELTKARCGVFDVALICNSSPFNPGFAAQLRRSGTMVLYIHHEPVSIWNWSNYRLEGWRQIVRYPFSAYFSIRTLQNSSGVIVPSEAARRDYGEHYRKYNRRVHTMPLLFEDESIQESPEHVPTRACFGFIGSATKAHGIDRFVALAKHAMRCGSAISFLIATRRDLSELLRKDQELAGFAACGRIRIVHGKVLTNAEINRFYMECFCVWNVYRRSMQSGVLPRAFMAGTPVLASRVGSFPNFVREGVNGEFAEDPENPVLLLEQVERIRARNEEYSAGCRRAFMEIFDYRANTSRLATIIDAVREELLPAYIPSLAEKA